MVGDFTNISPAAPQAEAYGCSPTSAEGRLSAFSLASADVSFLVQGGVAAKNVTVQPPGHTFTLH